MQHQVFDPWAGANPNPISKLSLSPYDDIDDFLAFGHSNIVTWQKSGKKKKKRLVQSNFG